MSSTFLAVPLKSTNEVDLAKPLTSYIETIYQTSDDIGSEIREAVQELNKLRNKACNQPLDKHQSALDVLTRLVVLSPIVNICRNFAFIDSVNHKRFVNSFLHLNVIQIKAFATPSALLDCDLAAHQKVRTSSSLISSHSFSHHFDTTPTRDPVMTYDWPLFSSPHYLSSSK